MRQYIIDGERFGTLPEFYAELDRAMLRGQAWGHNLDAFNDVLRGGFGTPVDGFEICWRNHELSRQCLGDETFETLLDIIRTHGPGGPEAEDKVLLRLE
jgi:RNAse (barnase) inhibitor barstar